MAVKKQFADSPKQPNKIRFVLLEADLSDSNLSELTAAITQALRPAYSARSLSNNGKQQSQLGAGRTEAPPTPVDDNDEALDVEFEEATPVPQETKAAKPPRPKKTKAPNYLHDLIKDTDSFKAFAKEKAPDSKNLQYLVAAYWLKEYGYNPEVNADKMYTCYKTAEWPSGFNDWSQTFHNLVHSEHMRKVAKLNSPSTLLASI